MPWALNFFLLQIELPDATPDPIAIMFRVKAEARGIVFAEGVSQDYVAELSAELTDEEWCTEQMVWSGSCC